MTGPKYVPAPRVSALVALILLAGCACDPVERWVYGSFSHSLPREWGLVHADSGKSWHRQDCVASVRWPIMSGNATAEDRLSIFKKAVHSDARAIAKLVRIWEMGRRRLQEELRLVEKREQHGVVLGEAESSGKGFVNYAVLVRLSDGRPRPSEMNYALLHFVAASEKSIESSIIVECHFTGRNQLRYAYGFCNGITYRGIRIRIPREMKLEELVEQDAPADGQ